MVDAVQAVFLVAAPLAALALLVVLRLPEVPLQSRQDKPQAQPEPARVPVGASR